MLPRYSTSWGGSCNTSGKSSSTGMIRSLTTFIKSGPNGDVSCLSWQPFISLGVICLQGKLLSWLNFMDLLTPQKKPMQVSSKSASNTQIEEFTHPSLSPRQRFLPSRDYPFPDLSCVELCFSLGCFAALWRLSRSLLDLSLHGQTVQSFWAGYLATHEDSRCLLVIECPPLLIGYLRRVGNTFLVQKT